MCEERVVVSESLLRKLEAKVASLKYPTVTFVLAYLVGVLVRRRPSLQRWMKAYNGGNSAIHNKLKPTIIYNKSYYIRKLEFTYAINGNVWQLIAFFAMVHLK